MNRLMLAAAAAALLIAAAPPAPHPVQLHWLAGAWISETGEGWTEETWSVPRGGVMLGTGSSGRGDSVRDWEFMRIAVDPDGVPVFWGSPKAAVPVPFRAVSIGAAEIVFENLEHDYPQRITYRREGAALVATISAADGSNATSWRYRPR